MASLRDRRWIALVFAFGLAASILMVARSQVFGDQLSLLGRGWQLAENGQWVPLGPPATKGGAQIGGLTGLLTGLPLMLWEDHRAPTALVLVFHLAAYLLLDRLARRALQPEERFLLALLYWLNPFRLFFSGFLWNPNYLFLAGAAHLWTAWRLRALPRFWLSFVHALTLGLAIQLHAASFILAIASLLLWWRRYLRLHPGGVALAAALVAASLVPWVLAVAAEPALLPGSEAPPGSALHFPERMLKGLGHWLRFPGLGFGGAMTCLDFAALGGPGLERLRPALAVLKWAGLLPTLALAAWCNGQLWRHRRRSWKAPIADSAPVRLWLAGYVRWTLLAALAGCGLSPTSIAHWYLLPVLHAAVLPVVLVGGALLRSRRARLAQRTAWAYALVMLLLGPALALGAPPYRCGPPRCRGAAYRMPSLPTAHPMLDRLGIRRTCPVVTGDPDGWLPPGLEEAVPPGTLRMPWAPPPP